MELSPIGCGDNNAMYALYVDDQEFDSQPYVLLVSGSEEFLEKCVKDLEARQEIYLAANKDLSTAWEPLYQNYWKDPVKDYEAFGEKLRVAGAPVMKKHGLSEDYETQLSVNTYRERIFSVEEIETKIDIDKFFCLMKNTSS